MRYLSLFSGIGGFEVAIHQVFGSKATCVGYSEIDKDAIKEYERHYPDHQNLGDINFIKKKDIDKLGEIDLVVGGFPCNDLSSARHVARPGLDGVKSGLFWIMLKVLKWILKSNPFVQIIIENNASMAHKWRDMITNELSRVFKRHVYCNYFDSSQWVLQRRRRFYWTLKEIPEYKGKQLQTFEDVLESTVSSKYLVSDTMIKSKNQPYHEGKSGIIWDLDKKMFKPVPYKTRWKSSISIVTDNHIKCFTTTRHDNILYDLRFEPPILRYFTKKEISILFGFPYDYIKSESPHITQKLFGMTVVPPVIKHIISHLF